ncbi:MAG: NAD(P)-dependent oxidoreductase [bacterium]|nr:NAD(P)-dependent oxidoreductase [bacterium]
MQDQKILITGPTSQVALPIARELALHNDVWGLARFSNPRDLERVEALGVKCIAADLAVDPLDSVPDDLDFVLHFAVVKGGDGDFDYDLSANAEGVGRLMSSCRNAKAFLHCSSTAVYQPAGRKPLLETDPLGDNHRVIMPTYSLCKIAGEAVARFGAREFNLPTTIARLCVPYGDNGGWPAIHLAFIVGGHKIVVHPDAPNLFNPIHEADILAHIPRLLEAASVPATIVNWGGSESLSIEDWCDYLGRLTGHTPEYASSDRTIGSVTIDPTRMHELLGPTSVDWRDGLRQMVRARYPDLTLAEAD